MMDPAKIGMHSELKGALERDAPKTGRREEMARIEAWKAQA